jgi:KRAB domain-containing zinc finger protein
MENIKQESAMEFVLILQPRDVNFQLEMKDFNCMVCDKKFDTKENLKFHLAFHKEKVSCKFCSRKLLPKNLERHMKYHENLSCKICSKSFLATANLAQHMKVHEKSFECDKCGKKFARKFYLENHKLSHVKSQPYQCDLCPSAFTHKTSLVTHLRSNHIGNLDFINCSKCRYKTKSANAFNKHKKTHNKSHCCPKCEKKFPDSSKLKRHIAVHEAIKPFQCNQCPFRARNKHDLKQHEKIHLKHLKM